MTQPDSSPVSTAPASTPLAEVRVRAATQDDVRLVTELDNQITGIAKPEYWQDLFNRYGGRGRNRYFLVADLEGRLVGYILGEVRAWEFGSPPCGWIFGTSVDPKARLHGVGQKLFEAITAGFRKSGITNLRTMVERDNVLLLSFFRSQGMMAGGFVQLEMDLD